MKTWMKIGLAFGFMVTFLESVIATANWWRGGALVWWEWALVGALPVLLAIYVRYFSIFGCGCCVSPEDRLPR
jgi:hypothetical protein